MPSHPANAPQSHPRAGHAPQAATFWAEPPHTAASVVEEASPGMGCDVDPSPEAGCDVDASPASVELEVEDPGWEDVGFAGATRPQPATDTASAAKVADIVQSMVGLHLLCMARR